MRTIADKSWKGVDILSLVLVACLIAAGAVFVSSATYASSNPMGARQVVWASVAALALLAGLLLPYSIWVDYGYIAYGLTVAMLFWLLLFGTRTAGSKAWFKFGFISLQPSELAKVAAILACASFVKSLSDSGVGLRELMVLSGLVAIPMLLTMLQPDFGTATTFIPIAASCFFLSKLPLAKILRWSAAGLCLMLVLLAIGWMTFFKPYQKERIRTFLDPSHDPRGSGYQVSQAKIAVGSGELIGKGLRSGTQNRLSFLPKPHTDFIFGVIAEETGFLGSMVVLGLFFVFLNRILETARLARDEEGRLLTVCVFAVILYHVLINVGMVLGLLPTTGIPLPFLSYGGSSLLATAWMTGLVLNVRWNRFGHE